MGKLLKVSEAADLIGVSQRQIRAWLKVGADPIPSVSVGDTGRVRLVIEDEIEDWLKRRAEKDSGGAA